jgi:NAD(P)-dependent dehydrogenase (short-subunit alcohol dehydrogenase family)
MERLDGKVAVVTGAASGIGLALCERFAAEGMRVAMADVDAAALEREAARLAADGTEVLAVPTDVTSWDACDALAAAVLERFGGVHLLCLNAGVQLPAPTWELTRAEWEWVLGVNLGGVVHGLRSFVAGMVERGEPGHIVVTASVGGLVPFPNIGAYTAAKYGVVGLTESLAQDLRSNGAPIGVSVLCPGPTLSSLRENSRALRPEAGRDVPLVTEVPRVSADAVASLVVDAVRENRFWILTHPEYDDAIRRRYEAMLDAGGVVVAEVAR